MEKFSFINRLRSFKYAIKGIFLLFQKEHNAWIHGLLAICAICLGFYFSISVPEWISIIIVIGLVLAAEAFNTAIEIMADYIQPDQDQRIASIKDLAAGGVLLTAISAFLVGLIIFLPKIIHLFGE